MVCRRKTTLWRTQRRRVSIPSPDALRRFQLQCSSQAIVLTLVLTPTFLFFPSSPWLQIAEKAHRRAALAAQKTTGFMLIPSRSFSPLPTLAANWDSDMSSAFLASHAQG